MTKTIRFGAAGIAMFAAMGMSTAAHADTASADATAEVLEALVLTNQAPLDFGAMVVSGAGVVVLAADGTLNCGATNIVCSGTTSTAEFDVEGTANKDVTISLPSSAIELVVQGGSAAVANQVMTITALTSSDNGTTGPEVGLDGSGQATFTVGGTLNVGATQDAGVYEGSFDVTVEYS